ncbi:angio-associated migratory cell protein-like isoform X2 [Limulus polyphemus]|nr:angio-associated migratory cell protein-like isoform X2 [Limulus polyphemus]XP_013794714.1 angio-associated migratory cell protein-like isoform X2 [Limulus polyphemus]XP_013794721.1 angio-associated migratory cell protein-like isoform X2 [Limulus polyphemus]XP_022238108.1 angio-associated migratory cell protein-like isoform X2 [Limulus polyphemus]
MHRDTPSPMEGPDEMDDDGLVLDDDIEVIEDEDIEIEDDEDSLDDGVVEGAAGASYSVKDDSVHVFKKHTGAVFCCDVDQSGTYAVSGGEDDKAYVWRIADGEVLLNCLGHKDSVVNVGFNHDSTLAVTGDMSGVIKVWKLDSKENIWSFETTDLRWLEWHHGTNVLLAGTVDGDSWLWKIPSGECKTFQSFGVPNCCGKVLPDGKRAVIGYEDGTVRIWDLKSASVLHGITDKLAHEEAVTVMDCCKDNTLVLTGSTDCTAKLINTNSGKVLATFQCNDKPGDEKSSNSVESVGFCSSLPLVATGTLSGTLFIWDIPTQTQRSAIQLQAGIVKLLWDNQLPLIYTSTLDGVVSLWDGRSGHSVTTWAGHCAEILDMVLSRDGQTLITASEDKTCRVFKTDKKQ